MEPTVSLTIDFLRRPEGEPLDALTCRMKSPEAKLPAGEDSWLSARGLFGPKSGASPSECAGDLSAPGSKCCPESKSSFLLQ
mmetsp:Transcript_8222/g.19358  ORF Transcript_8222/g.19358 Transcript_8222/m.19358 type:complete len:82 (-) Transcript_8222:417-662(-)